MKETMKADVLGSTPAVPKLILHVEERYAACGFTMPAAKGLGRFLLSFLG